MKNRIIESFIVALGLLLLGLSIRSGINAFSQRNRTVTVKGLAEIEMPADKVIWPLPYKEVGNDLPSLYNNLKMKNQTILSFLKSKGIKDEEISISAPQVVDMQAERYNVSKSPYRYNITSVVTVMSD
ncbi:MAG TPA: SIMPL domain-containing protein, partial [Acetivibrio sp.]|nr:SIMPL domain-containing protein [Acetivibrio sp.]